MSGLPTAARISGSDASALFWLWPPFDSIDFFGNQDSWPTTAAKTETVASPPGFCRPVHGPLPPRLRPAVDGESPGARAGGTAVTGFRAAGAGAIRRKPNTEKPRERGSKKKRCVSLGPALDPA